MATTTLTTINFAIQKIADLNTQIPGTTGLKFAALDAPVYDGTSCVFYGHSANKQPEGLYASINGALLTRISDNLTTIPALQGPPTSAEDKNGRIRKAFLPYLIAQQLFPAMNQLTIPRPAVLNGKVIFFAANWLPDVDNSGIFQFDPSTQTYTPLALTKSGYFKNTNIAQPAVTQQGLVYFSTCGINGGLQTAGVYALKPLHFTDGKKEVVEQLLDITKAKTKDNIQMTDVGNCQLLLLHPGNALIVYGSYLSSGSPADALFLHNIGTDSTQLQRLIKGGDTLGSYTIAHQGLYREISVAQGLMAFNCLLKGDADNTAVAVLDIADTGSKPILIAYSAGVIPGGGGTFNGDSFAMPPVTDGTRVVFTGGYTRDTDSSTKTGLFIWNTKTKTGTKLIDSDAEIDGQRIANFNLTTSSFVNGKLAIQVVFAGMGNSTGNFIFDLSQY